MSSISVLQRARKRGASECEAREKDECYSRNQLAERVGFEPTIPVKVCPLSRRIVSTTHAPLRAKIRASGRAEACFRLYLPIGWLQVNKRATRTMAPATIRPKPLNRTHCESSAID